MISWRINQNMAAKFMWKKWFSNICKNEKSIHFAVAFIRKQKSISLRHFWHPCAFMWCTVLCFSLSVHSVVLTTCVCRKNDHNFWQSYFAAAIYLSVYLCTDEWYEKVYQFLPLLSHLLTKSNYDECTLFWLNNDFHFRLRYTKHKESWRIK